MTMSWVYGLLSLCILMGNAFWAAIAFIGVGVLFMGFRGWEDELFDRLLVLEHQGWECVS
jgi:hypothetical protein